MTQRARILEQNHHVGDMPKSPKHAVARVVAAERIVSAIRIVRGQRVMLDADLAALYGVTTKRLNEQVRRNRDRFPEDFAFQLTVEEAAALRSQIATSNVGRGGSWTVSSGWCSKRFVS